MDGQEVDREVAGERGASCEPPDPDGRLEQLGAATGLIAVVAVGVATAAAEQLGEDPGQLRGPAWLWWTLYLGYLGAFLLYAYTPLAWTRRGERMLVAVLIVTGGALFALYPLGWTGVVLVVTAASASFLLSPRAVAAVVAGQTLLIAVVMAADGWHPGEVIMSAVVYGSFQAFAALVTLSQRREADARDELARTHGELEEAHTRLAHAHGELRAATALLASSSRSAERLRIARDLHDVVGHQLTALTLELEVASHDHGSASAPHIVRARRVAKDLLHDVRETVGELRTQPQDLEAGLRELVRDLPGLHVDLHVEELTPVDDDHAMTVLRTVQELVTNTLRHAGAARLEIRVVADDGGIELRTRDDGHGTRTLVPGNGLRGVRERIEQHGGRVAFEPGSNGTGFAVDARLPVP